VNLGIDCIQGWRLVDAREVPTQPIGKKNSVVWEDDWLVISRLGAEDSDYFRLEFAPNMSFDVLPSSQFIIDSSPASLPPATARHLLADQVVPRIVAHSGSLVLHAGAVRNEDNAILFVGVSGRGKSTLVASFDQRHYALMGDDAMIIASVDKRQCASPVYLSLRLLPDSIAAVMPRTVTTTSVAHYSAKQRVDVIAPGEDPRPPVPIEAIFLLRAPSSDDQVRVNRLTVAQACMAFVENSFALDPSDLSLARLRLHNATALARQVPAFEISYPHDYARLPEVRKAILSQLN
jgi:hypothetical protein